MANLLAQPLPWQNEQWQRIFQQREAGQLAHALLLAGPPAVGKRIFARALGYALLCQSPSHGFACGECKACALLSAQTHPDFLWLAPEESGKAVKIDQVRQLVETMAQTAQQGGIKVVVVEPAEAMNRNSANALLKTLEEPTGNALLMLVTDAPGRLLPTIRSRCQRLEFPVPPLDVTRSWLALRGVEAAKLESVLAEADGKPLLASEFLDGEGFAARQELSAEMAAVLSRQMSAVTLAERWQQRDWQDLLKWLHVRLAQALRNKLGKLTVADVAVTELARAEPVALFALMDIVNGLLNQTQNGGNPNRQLAIETFLFSACDAVSRKTV
ncbi:MAG: polymerase subunit delta [Verrucomicrobiaceae bacterium]|nr:polymerase subunit delta [Verrucomicrobiaceae bacterium]